MAARLGTSNNQASNLGLPAGLCNFKDLSREQAPTCPCRRFYLDHTRLATGASTPDSAWCFCGHHACFHDHHSAATSTGTQSTQQLPPPQDEILTQTPTRRSTSGLASQRYISQEEASIYDGRLGGTAPDAGLDSEDQGLWHALNAFARRQADQGSQHSVALASTVVPSVSTGRGSGSSVQRAISHHSVVELRRTGNASPVLAAFNNVINDSASETEKNTPSIHGTSFVPRPGPLQQQAHISEPRARARHCQQSPLSTIANESPLQQAIFTTTPIHTNTAHDATSIHELQNIVKSYALRLDLLESMSYTHVPLDEVEDKFDHIDTRLSILEEFRSSLEPQLSPHNEPMSSKNTSRKRRLLPTEVTTSFDSDAALSQQTDASSYSAVSATAAVYAEYNGRLETMSLRISTLERMVPSNAHPWQIEIVLLPYGRHLPGIWSVAGIDEHRRSDRLTAREEWEAETSAGNVLGTSANTRPGWSTDSIKAWADTASEWLTAKACGPNGPVYHRLKSRGFVQNVQVESPDAQHFMRLCKVAFAEVLPYISIRGQTPSTRLEFDALQEVFVPLRKIRKESRLRFLAPSEMVSSALWTPAFLEASVFMKGRDHHRRLYMTVPEAYIQQEDDGWTWAKIRELPPVKAPGRRFGVFADAEEHRSGSCWSTNAKLDIPLATSFTSSTGLESVRSTRTPIASRLEPTGHLDPAMVSPVSQHRTLRDVRRQTVSIPLGVDIDVAADVANSKRRVASFEDASSNLKRRKKSMSSQPPRPGPACTPRLSREPPSPYTSEYPQDNRSDNTSGRRVVLTPLAYETPHSHTNNAVAALYFIDRDGDTDVETELLETPHGRARLGQRAWHGFDREPSCTPTQLQELNRTEDTVIIRGSDGDESELDE